MTYTPVYTSLDAIQSLLQIKIESDTHPNITDVLSWIEEVETDLKDKSLGTYTTSGYVTFDFPYTNKTWKDTVALRYSDIPVNIVGKVVSLPFSPIISITSMDYNAASLDTATDWTQLTEGPGVDSDFIILKDTDNNGYALFLYGSSIDNYGRQKLRASYTYGHAVEAVVLREYATLKVCKKVLFARVMSAQPVGISKYRGPDLQEFINTELTDIESKLDDRIKEIEDQLLPQSKISIGFI
jgi:hypothetical protein